MTTTLVPFEPWHIEHFQNYGGQEHLVLSSTPDDIRALKERGSSFTAMIGDRITGCGGVIHLNKYRGLVWGLFQETGRNEFVGIHMATRRVLSQYPLKRLEAFVDPRSHRAMKWIAMLGFQIERPYIPYFYDDGAGTSAWAYYPGGQDGV